MSQVTSKDGTQIAYDRQGSGPAVILVSGAFVDRSENAPLATELTAHFTVYNYDRRGRGQSGDTLPYALEREFEDLQALIEAAGSSAHLYGISSGGALALEATAAGLEVEKLAVYEAPYSMAEDVPQQQREYVEQLKGLLAEGCRGDAAALFLQTVGMPEAMIAQTRNSEVWPSLEALAHTLVYDAACMGNGQPPTARLARITQPTLVATGGGSPESFEGGGGDFFAQAAEVLAASIPHAQNEVIPDQTHMVDATALAPVLVRFFTG